MGTGQTMLTIFALALLGMLFLTNNRNTLDQRESIESAEWEILASSLATSLVERATGLAFDQNTVSSDVSSPNSLTPVPSLGGEGAAETVGPYREARFNDFDDYNNFKKDVSGDTLAVGGTANFHIRSRVQYVAIVGDHIDSSSVRTYHKRLTVWVWSESMRDTVSYQTIYSYWYFR
ncbi:MAG: hypothetical protein WB699_07635 [Bacteroidota bacterium]